MIFNQVFRKNQTGDNVNGENSAFRSTVVRCIAGLLVAAFVPMGVGADTGDDSRPNILLIVADDLGYADLGVHGSDIRTPNIDALAEEGVLFTNFHTAPMCAPTRAMLLSGNNNHVAGMARQHPSEPIKSQMPGYEAHLSDRIIPLPQLLRDAGYHTYTTGKWHLGVEEDNSPRAAGFDRSFNLVDGAGNHWDSVGFANRSSIYRADGQLAQYPDGRYSTEFYTERLIEYIDSNKGDGRPFFAFAAYTTPHWPLQVPEAELDRYRGVYDDGYDALREKNFESLKSAGVISGDARLPARNQAITPWDKLDAAEQKIESRKMELYAAMVENLDHHVGKLIDYLRQNGLYENTLVVFMSDNGAAAEDFYNRGPYTEYVQDHFDNRLENMGRPDSFVSYGPQWAEAGSAPFSNYKGSVYQGGIRAPLVIAGSGVSKSDSFNHDYLTLMDLAPTFLAMANADYPEDGSAAPMLGANLQGLLSGQTGPVHSDDYVTVLSHRGRTFIRKGKWKIVADVRPFDESRFELYDVVADPGESRDLSQDFPEVRQELIELWRERRVELGIVLPLDL